MSMIAVHTSSTWHFTYQDPGNQTIYVHATLWSVKL